MTTEVPVVISKPQDTLLLKVSIVWQILCQTPQETLGFFLKAGKLYSSGRGGTHEPLMSDGFLSVTISYVI